MKACLTSLYVLICATLSAAELRYFNPAVLGKSVDEPVRLLLPGRAEALVPWLIETEVKDGHYMAGRVGYSKHVTS